MEELFAWIRGLAAFLILIGLLIQLLPDSSYRRYLRFFSGLILILLICRPIFRMSGLEKYLEQKLELFSLEQNRSELEVQLALAEGEYQEQLTREYQELIREQVTDLADAQGYQVLECQAELILEPEEEDFGRVRSLMIVLAPVGTEAAEIYVEPVQIGAADSSGEAKALLSPLRQEILQFYELSGDALTLTVRE